MSLTVSPPREALAWKTPLYDQFWKLKDEVPGSILFFRLGDFYELFGDDALKAAPLLEVQLTARNKNNPEPIPMCGVPAHALDSYAENLLAHGLKIAIANQEEVDESAGRKLVERKIVRILTPGLPIDYEKLKGRESHWLCSLARKPRTQHVQFLVFDLLGSRLFEGDVESVQALQDLLLRLKPKEILIESTWYADPKSLAHWNLDPENSNFLLSNSKIHWTAWGTNNARKNLEEYLCYTQRMSHEELRKILPEARGLNYLSGEKSHDYAQIPQSVLEQWAVFPELFELFDKCGSVLGSRRLKEILARPLMNRDRLLNRQELLQSLDEKSFLEFSREVYDFERLLGRFRLGVAQAQELLRFRSSLKHALAALETLSLSQQTWQQFLKYENLKSSDHFIELKELSKELERALVDVTEFIDFKKGTGSLGLIRESYDTEFDRLQSLNLKGEEWLQQYEERLRQETAIPSLKVRSNRVFGYYIEVTKTHLSKIPTGFDRKQTTVQGERFTTVELREREREILSASSKAEGRALELVSSLIQKILKLDEPLKQFIDLFSWADAWAGVKKSISFLKVKGPWIYPQIEISDDSSEHHFQIDEARHPILEAIYGNFIPNSLSLGKESQRLMLLTGPNMAGKSTLMRQTGLCLLMGQCGFPVPASKMKFHPCSGFFSRMGASDRILAGESTFMVEMKETAAILRESDRKSFVLIDEIGRGTSTTDGLSIARAVLEHLHHKTQSICIFATHYHELSEDAEALPEAFNASMGIQEWEGELVFLRKLIKEAAKSSYGLYVAEWAGLPTSLLARAEEELVRLESLKQVSTEISLAPTKVQMGLFESTGDSLEVTRLKKQIAQVESTVLALENNLKTQKAINQKILFQLKNLIDESNFESNSIFANEKTLDS